MRKRTPPKKSNAIEVAGAGAAGGGLGTAIAAWANTLPENSKYKTILLVGAPLFAIGISGLGLFIKTVYVDPFVIKKKSEAADLTMDRVLEDARINARKVLADPDATDDHKRDVRKIVEDLEKLRLKKITERMEVVAID